MSDSIPVVGLDPDPAHDGHETATSTTGTNGVVGQAAPRTRVHFPCFEGLRALAAVMVVVHHASSFAGDGRAPAAFTRTAALLDSGVIVFFVISGFLIYRPFVVAQIEGRRPMRTRAFWWRRLLRLVPAYWLALTVLLVLGATNLNRGWWRYYFFAQVYDRHTVTNGLVQAWSLCVEVLFYLLVPLWALMMRHLAGSMSPAAVARRHLAGCAVLFASGFVSRGLISALNPQWRSISFEWLPTNIDVFAVGMALAVLSAWAATDDRLRARLDRLARVGELWWLAAIGLFAWYVVRVGPVPLSRLADPNGAYRGWYWQQRQLVLGVVSGLLLVPAVFGSADRGLLRAVLRCRPVAWVGLMSYGLYLWHFGFMNLAVEQRDPATNALLRGGWLHTPARNSNILVVGGIGLGLGLLAALISFYAMERPLERLKSLVR